mmetsp:Transcript_31286/g.45775  ORF Transcript_31286/g.45775 Transcript_31286/m.45775 type:complete len:237 (-) Transcript_31286:458-1168(-)
MAAPTELAMVQPRARATTARTQWISANNGHRQCSVWSAMCERALRARAWLSMACLKTSTCISSSTCPSRIFRKSAKSADSCENSASATPCGGTCVCRTMVRTPPKLWTRTEIHLRRYTTQMRLAFTSAFTGVCSTSASTSPSSLALVPTKNRARSRKSKRPTSGGRGRTTSASCRMKWCLGSTERSSPRHAATCCRIWAASTAPSLIRSKFRPNLQCSYAWETKWRWAIQYSKLCW